MPTSLRGQGRSALRGARSEPSHVEPCTRPFLGAPSCRPDLQYPFCVRCNDLGSAARARGAYLQRKSTNPQVVTCYFRLDRHLPFPPAIFGGRNDETCAL